MNTDRLIPIPASSIAAALNTKWTNAYSFLGFTFSSTSINNNVTFDSFNQNQFALDLAYYLEPEDLWYLLFQTSNMFVNVTYNSIQLVFTQSNIFQILKHKWIKCITQLPNSSLNTISIDNENIQFIFNTVVENLPEFVEIERYKINVILTNYLDDYFIPVSTISNYPQITQTYTIDWDKIRARFNYRTDSTL